MALSQTRRMEEAGDTMSSLWALRTTRNREILRLLIPEDGPVQMRLVARKLAAREQGTPIGELDNSVITNLKADLCQARLPKLHEAGLVEWQSGPGLVTTTEQTMADSGVRLVLQLQSDREADAVIRTLTSPRRKAVLEHLYQSDTELTCTEIAAHLVEDRDEQVELELLDASLHHTTLHELDDGGFIEYNLATETATITPRGQKVCNFSDALA